MSNSICERCGKYEKECRCEKLSFINHKYNAKCPECGKLGNTYNAIEPDYKCECGFREHEDVFVYEFELSEKGLENERL